MDAVIVSEFGKREIFYPGVWVFAARDAEIGFEFLVHSFCLTIGLGVIGSREGIGVLEKMSKF